MDAPNGKGTADLMATGPNAEINVKTLLVGQDLYVQVPGITKAGTWTHLDVSRLPEGANVGLRPGQIDPANTAKLLTSTTDVQQVDARSYAGTLDLTKAAGLAGVDQVDHRQLRRRGPERAVHRRARRPGPAVRADHPAARGQRPAGAAARGALHRLRHCRSTAERPAASEITEAPDSLYTSLGG